MTAYEYYIFSFGKSMCKVLLPNSTLWGRKDNIRILIVWRGSKLNEYSIASDKGLAISIIPGSPPNGLSSICLDLPKPNLRRLTISIFIILFLIALFIILSFVYVEISIGFE